MNLGCSDCRCQKWGYKDPLSFFPEEFRPPTPPESQKLRSHFSHASVPYSGVLARAPGEPATRQHPDFVEEAGDGRVA